LKKLLTSRFEIVEVNEYNTSKLYNKTLKELENVCVKGKGKSKISGRCYQDYIVIFG
jgi:hypothetical protein